MRHLLLLVIIGLVSICPLFSQEKTDPKNIFLSAEEYLLYEEYEEALALYLKLVNQHFVNAYINHRIGECYLQIPGKKEKAIPYLEEASKEISPKIKEGNFKEEKAPVRTLFYLGDAYQVNNQLDKAIEAYKKFEKEMAIQDIYNMDYVNQQLESCLNAKNLVKKPLEIKISNIGKAVNNEFSNEMPVVSADGQAMVYISKLKFYNAIFFTKKTGDAWTEPVNITPQLRSDGDYYPCFLSLDKKTLLLTRIEGFTENIYISKFANKRWQEPQKLNKNINTKFVESFASLSSDGKTLYFASNRKGGYGGFDLYKSELNAAENNWGEAINLGSEINTPLNEVSVKISANGNTLYFSSQCHYNMGGFDIFYSKKTKNNQWSTPINMGYPINTTDDDLYYCPLENENYAYISTFDKNGFGQKDINIIEFNASKKISAVNVQGKICLNDYSNITGTGLIKVFYTDLNKNETKEIPLNKNNFSIQLSPGTYKFTFNSNLYQQTEKTIVVPENYLRKDLEFSIKVNPLEEKNNKLFSKK